MNSRATGAFTFRVGAFKRRIAWVFGLQFVVLLIICAMGLYNVAPWEAVVVLILITTVLACLATQHEWGPIRALARLIDGWSEGSPTRMRSSRSGCRGAPMPTWLRWRGGCTA